MSISNRSPKPLPENLGVAALEAVRKMKRGEGQFRVHNPVPGSAEIAALRGRLELTQAEFAARFGLGLDALRQWEQGRRAPDGAAKTLLALIAVDPKTVEKLVKKAGLAA